MQGAARYFGPAHIRPHHAVAESFCVGPAGRVTHNYTAEHCALLPDEPPTEQVTYKKVKQFACAGCGQQWEEAVQKR